MRKKKKEKGAHGLLHGWRSRSLVNACQPSSRKGKAISRLRKRAAQAGRQAHSKAEKPRRLTLPGLMHWNWPWTGRVWPWSMVMLPPARLGRVTDPPARVCMPPMPDMGRLLIRVMDIFSTGFVPVRRKSFAVVLSYFTQY